jgi:hypothetical protein
VTVATPDELKVTLAEPVAGILTSPVALAPNDADVEPVDG